MRDILKKIVDYFKQRWNDEDESETNVKLSTQDLRDIANISGENSKLRYEIEQLRKTSDTCTRIVMYMRDKYPDTYSLILDEMAMDR